MVNPVRWAGQGRAGIRAACPALRQTEPWASHKAGVVSSEAKGIVEGMADQVGDDLHRRGSWVDGGR